jgi:hypothetical protein
MLQPIISQLNTIRIVLASGSPRRQELIQNIVSIITSVIQLRFVQIILRLFFVGAGNTQATLVSRNGVTRLSLGPWGCGVGMEGFG